MTWPDSVNMTSVGRSEHKESSDGALPLLWKWSIAAAILAFAVHLPAAENGFTNWDDTAYIHNNPHLTAADGLQRIWTTDESPQYYPLTFTSFWLEYQLWETDPRGYHLVNIALHAINAALVVVLMSTLGMSAPAAFVVAILFALSPVQVMSVAWVAERKNVLSTLFGLVAMIFGFRFLRAGGVGRYTLGTCAFVLALLSKTAWLMVPIVVALGGRWLFGTGGRRLAWLVLSWLMLSCLAGYATLYMEQQFTGETYPLSQRLLLAPGALLFYVYKTLLPINLAPYYPRWDVSTDSIVSWIPAGVVICCALVVVLVRRRIRAIVLWGLCAFVLFLLPALGWIPFANMDLTWVSDHFLYYACIGFYAVVVSVFSRVVRDRSVASAIVIAIGVCLSVMTWRQIPVWKDARSMWASALQTDPDSYVAHAGLGMAHLAEHDYSRAVASFRRALQIKPDDAKARSDLAWALIRLDRYDEAEKQFRTVLKYSPGTASAHLQLGLLARRRGELTSAVAHFRSARDSDPGYGDAAIHLARALIREQKIADARNVLRDCLNHSPRSVGVIRELAALNEQIGRLDEAAELRRRAVDNNPRQSRNHFALGAVLARMGQHEEAIRSYRRAIELNPEQAVYWHNLGSALLELKWTDEAIEAIQKAVEINPDDHRAWNSLAAAFAGEGSYEQAADCLDRALAVDPAYANAHHRKAKLLADQGRYSDAAAYLERTIGGLPPQEQIPLANTLARLLAACPDASVRDPAAALTIARRINQAMGQASGEALDTLAISLAANGDFDAAVTTCERSLRILREQGQSREAIQVQKRLQSYRRGQPYVGP